MALYKASRAVLALGPRAARHAACGLHLAAPGYPTPNPCNGHAPRTNWHWLRGLRALSLASSTDPKIPKRPAPPMPCRLETCPAAS